MVHMDVVEEAYWKRCMAMKLALECKEVALRKARRRIRKNKEVKELEALARQREADEAEAARQAAEARL